MNAEQFRDFIFARSDTASPTYTSLLKSLLPATQEKIVFTHGDVRPANVRVAQDDGGNWKVAVINDWKFSGFYPEYWESVNATNTLTPADHLD